MDRPSKKSTEQKTSHTNSKHKLVNPLSKTVNPRDISRDVLQVSNSNHRHLNSSPSCSRSTQSAEKENHNHGQQFEDGDLEMQDDDDDDHDAEIVNRSKDYSPTDHNPQHSNSNGRFNGNQRSKLGPSTSSSLLTSDQRPLQPYPQSLLDEDVQLGGIGAASDDDSIIDPHNFQSRPLLWGQDDFRDGDLVLSAEDKPIFRMDAFGMSLARGRIWIGASDAVSTLK